MRNGVITLCLVLSGLIILDSLNIGHSLTMFLLVGIIPGTNIVVSGESMLQLFLLLIGFTLSRITISFAKFIETSYIELSQQKIRPSRVTQVKL